MPIKRSRDNTFSTSTLKTPRSQKSIIEFKWQPFQFIIPKPLKFTAIEHEAAQSEVEKFIQKQIIERVNENFVITLFIQTFSCGPKKDGYFRIILNLKKLNEFVDNFHFKMETLMSALSLIRPNCWFSSLDIKDAYYSVKIHSSSRPFLRFQWEVKFTSLLVYQWAWQVLRAFLRK
jgi:hypothetical protein